MIGLIEKQCKKRQVVKQGLFSVLSVALLLTTAPSFAAGETNRMVSMQMESVEGNPALRIVTEQPVGYHYTIYDADGPNRVVLSFPHMDIDNVSPLADVNQPPVQKVDVSSHDLTRGRLGRVEVMLSAVVGYDVVINGNEFVLILLQHTKQKAPEVVEPMVIETEPITVVAPEPAHDPIQTSAVVPAAVAEVTTPATKIMQVDIGTHFVTLQANGMIGIYKFFSLQGPERLVVDIYGVKPGFEERSFPLPDDFSKLRVGVYDDKLRFVFDALGTLPEYAVARKRDLVMIRWDVGRSTVSNTPNERGQLY